MNRNYCPFRQNDEKAGVETQSGGVYKIVPVPSHLLPACFKCAFFSVRKERAKRARSSVALFVTYPGPLVVLYVSMCVFFVTFFYHCSSCCERARLSLLLGLVRTLISGAFIPGRNREQQQLKKKLYTVEWEERNASG